MLQKACGKTKGRNSDDYDLWVSQPHSLPNAKRKIAFANDDDDATVRLVFTVGVRFPVRNAVHCVMLPPSATTCRKIVSHTRSLHSKVDTTAKEPYALVGSTLFGGRLREQRLPSARR